jgi:hypothetical protein
LAAAVVAPLVALGAAELDPFAAELDPLAAELDPLAAELELG